MASAKCREQLGLPGPEDRVYWRQIELIAKSLGTDGCSGPALQVYVRACWEHDIHYRTHKTLFGKPLTRKQADDIFFERHQEMSAMNGFSPMSWWRWSMLRLFGEKAWA